TVSSLVLDPLGSLTLTMSPFTLPTVGHDWRENATAPRHRMYPVTFGPCCSNSKRTSSLIAGCASQLFMVPCQTPVTSTVTSVRSIQSERAQPEPNASAAAIRSPARLFIRPRLGPPEGGDG